VRRAAGAPKWHEAVAHVARHFLANLLSGQFHQFILQLCY